MPKIGSSGITAIGITSGVGSMLIGAREAGFKIIGNIEWRRYYHTGTFEHNFYGAFMVKSMSEAPPLPKKIDLAIGHPECGNFSNLRTTSKVALDNPGDIPLFVEMVQKIHPRYFVMDNLPGSLVAYTMKQWSEQFPDYDLFPEWVSNYHYGNTQKNRRRFFLIGALREEKFCFVPGEFQHGKTMRDVLRGLTEKDRRSINHMHAPDDRIIPCGWAAHQLGIKRDGNKITLGELKEYIRDWPLGKNFQYLNMKGEMKLRPGYCKIKMDHVSPVLTGGGSALDNHYREDTLNPLTIRERARIQGCPDDFIFMPLDYFDDLQSYAAVYKQSGKFMPVEFCSYVAKQIAAHIQKRKFEATGERLANPNPHVDEAKQWYCENVEYSSPQRACDSCWLSRRCRITNPQQERKEPPMVKVRGKTNHQPKKKEKVLPPVPIQKIDMQIVLVEGKGSVRTTVPSVKMIPKKFPSDYHCSCKYCRKTIGELRPNSTEYYSRLERNKYYDPCERGKGQGHIAKTPLHIARWAVQNYSAPGDWVLDPTAGAGTTMVESLVQGRNAAGIELEYVDIIRANVTNHTKEKLRSVIGFGDARDIDKMIEFLKKRNIRPSLVVNNPPYFGDQSFPGPAKEGTGPQFRDKETTYFYDKALPNIAFLREGDEYWRTMTRIYKKCLDFLKPGGHFVVGVKDQMRQKKPDGLHEKLANILKSLDMISVGVAVLKHHPGTLFLNTYEKLHGVPPVRYQSIVVFKKGK